MKHLHHVTAVASDAQRTADFYTRILGLRLVKQTVNFDDPGSYHLYFADRTAQPGSVLTFFVWPQAGQGRWGLGTAHHLAFQTADAAAQDRWKRWLTDHGVAVTGPYDRRWFRSIYFTDPDGLLCEIATAGPGWTLDEPPEALGLREVAPPPELIAGGRDEAAIAAHTWPQPVEGIDEDMRLRRLHHVTCMTGDIAATDDFYTRVLGLRRVKRTVNFDDPAVPHLYYANAAGEPGSVITFFGYAPKAMHPGRMGIGTVHHIAFACEDSEAQAAWRRRLRGAGLNVTPVVDRKYFTSIYFRDPAGILLEIATLGPGFAVDEPSDALGTTLTLPDWLEPERRRLEELLPPLRT